MAEILNDEEVAAVSGGAAVKANTTDWTAAHWQPTDHPMGTTFTAYGYNWYVVKPGDTLSGIAVRYGRTVKDLMYWNPKTITNPNKIYAGDALVLGTGHL